MSNSEKMIKTNDGGKLGIALVGQRQSGKTALLSATLKLADQSLHSFPEEHPVFLSDERPLPDSADPTGTIEHVSTQVIQSLTNGGHYAATPEDRPLHYDLRLDYYEDPGAKAKRRSARKSVEVGDLGDPAERGELESIPLTITDLAGGLAFPGVESALRAGARERIRMQEAEAWISRVRHLMVCLPATYRADGDANVVLNYVRLFNRLRSPDCRVERLVLCLTKYETRWTAFGREAIEAALDPREFQRAVLEVVLDDDALRRSLLGLMGKKTASGRPVEICLCPVSVYGFVIKNGCANYDLHRDGMLIQAPGEGGLSFLQRSFALYPEMEARRYWQPFMIVDPFMYLVTGRQGQLTYPLDAFM